MAPPRNLGHVCQARRNQARKEEEKRLLQWARRQRGSMPRTRTMGTQTRPQSCVSASTETGKATIKLEHLPKSMRARVEAKREKREKERKKMEKQKRKERERWEAEQAKAKKQERKRAEAARKTHDERKGPKMLKPPNPNPINLREVLDAMSD